MFLTVVQMPLYARLAENSDLDVLMYQPSHD